MSETKNKNKRRLSIITLSLFSNKKTPKIYEEPNGVVGLGIVAAMHDPLCAKNSPNPAPVFSHRNSTRKNLSFEEMEMSEEYTCVISHVGRNLVKKREYFDGDFLGTTTEGSVEEFIFGTSFGSGDADADADATGDWMSSGLVDAYSVTVGQSFLSSCFLCTKQLHGLDIFMYRGETAFCSAECRYKHIFVDEHEKCGSRMLKPSDAFQCFSSLTSA